MKEGAENYHDERGILDTCCCERSIICLQSELMLNGNINTDSNLNLLNKLHFNHY